MNSLEKLNAVLNKDGRLIKYGVLTNEEVTDLICLQIGESEKTMHTAGNNNLIYFPTLLIIVYSFDYITGFNLIEQLKSEVYQANKNNLKIVHLKDLASVYDAEKQKYIFKSQFREIQI